jgi:hypothetical protein
MARIESPNSIKTSRVDRDDVFQDWNNLTFREIWPRWTEKPSGPAEADEGACSRERQKRDDFTGQSHAESTPLRICPQNP